MSHTRIVMILRFLEFWGTPPFCVQHGTCTGRWRIACGSITSSPPLSWLQPWLLSSDGSASLGWCDAFLGVPGEVFFVYFLVILLSVGHVISHAFAKDVMALHFSLLFLLSACSHGNGESCAGCHCHHQQLLSVLPTHEHPPAVVRAKPTYRHQEHRSVSTVSCSMFTSTYPS